MGAPASQFEQDVLVVVNAIAAVEQLMRDLNCVPPSKGEWKVPGSQTNLVDLSETVYVKAENTEVDTDYANPVTDWIALFNPFVIDGFLQMMKDHIRGLEELRFSNPDLADQLSVSRAVLGVANRLQSYVVSEAQTYEDGTRRSPERRLGVVEW